MNHSTAQASYVSGGVSMIKHFAMTKDGRLLSDNKAERLTDQDIEWFWTDFDQPSEEEVSLLKSHFHFHPLSVEDCVHLLADVPSSINTKIIFFSSYMR